MDSDLLAHFRYEPSSGLLFNKYGRQVGSYTRIYGRVLFRGRQYSISRLAWFLHYGAWPKGEIDHRNGDTHDNRIDNLRDCTRFENIRNQGVRSKNQTGFKGVWSEQYKGKKRFRSKICHNGVVTYLGQFTTPEEAAAAYDKAAINLHGEFASLNFKEGNKTNVTPST